MAVGDPLFLEALDYSAIEVRQLVSACLSPGVVGVGDFLVSERAAGANMSVDVAAGLVVVAGTDNAGQGNYVVPNDDVVNVAISAAPGSNSRIDVVYVKVRDNTEDSAGNDDGVIAVAEGTAAADPVAPSIPDSALALAEILIASGDTDIDDDQITDARVAAKFGGYTGGLYEQTTLLTTSALSTATKIMELGIPAQGVPYRVVASAAVRLLVTGTAGTVGGVLMALAVPDDAYPSAAHRRSEASVVRAPSGIQGFTPRVDEAVIEVADGSATTIELWGSQSGVTLTPNVSNGMNYIVARVEPL